MSRFVIRRLKNPRGKLDWILPILNLVCFFRHHPFAVLRKAWTFFNSKKRVRRTWKEVQCKKRLKIGDICRRNGDLCKQQPNLAPIQSKDEGVSFKMKISWRQPIEKTVKIQKRNNYKQKNNDLFFIKIANRRKNGGLQFDETSDFFGPNCWTHLNKNKSMFFCL